ncbi:MAG: RodZ domain-containing protein [Candidatus Omnitrophota bacterium]
MASVGSTLKTAREKKRLTLEEIGRKTRIHPKVLQAIEEDRAEKDLSRVYLKGFIKSYAREVGLNEEELAHEFWEGTQRLPLPVPSAAPESYWEEEAGVAPWVRRSLVAIAVFVCLYGAVWGVSKITRNVSFLSLGPRHSPLMPGAFSPYSFRIAEQQPLKLKLRAEENTWISVSSDGQLMYKGLLSKGKEEMWMAQKRFEVSLSDGGAVQLELNRRLLGIPGVKGRPLEKITMTRKGWGLGDQP